MHELKETDREAVLLRYFENRQFAEVGAKFGLNENAARMRVERALEKLRDIFRKRGITTATALASVISANAIQIAPANLAATLATISVATAGTGTFTLLKIMTVTKLKLAFSAIVIAGAATAFVHQQQTQTKLRAENKSLQQQLAQSQTDNENFSNRLAEIGDAKKLSDEQFDELLKLRGEVGVLRRQLEEAGNLREENQQLRAQAATRQTSTNQISSKDLFRLQEWHTINALKEVGLAMRIYAGDHNNQYATNFDQLAYALVVTNFEGNISLGAFEFMNVGLVDDTMPQMIISRERNPRRTPDGIWEREYGLADGSVQTQSSDNGNFDSYERQHSPQPNQ
jgi:Sigma-70, region 4